VFQTIAQRDQRIVGVVIDQVDRTFVRDAAGGAHLAGDTLHRGLQDFRIDYANHFYVREFAHGPGGVVVDVGLRIVWRPVLIIEQRIGDTAVGLVHTDDVAAGGKCSLVSFGSGSWRRCWSRAAAGFLFGGDGER